MWQCKKSQMCNGEKLNINEWNEKIIDRLPHFTYPKTMNVITVKQINKWNKVLKFVLIVFSCIGPFNKPIKIQLKHSIFKQLYM